jgi:GNAT superfamily N-acetyltransferase
MTVVQIDDPQRRSELCESLLGGLPEWFAIEEANAAFVRDVAELPTFAVDDEAFLSLKLHSPNAAEVFVVAVRRDRHRGGLGTQLLEAAEAYLCDRGVEYLQVKTLGASYPSEEYAATRQFYEARGFVRLEEIHGLWPDNPCLLMVKHLPCR